MGMLRGTLRDRAGRGRIRVGVAGILVAYTLLSAGPPLAAEDDAPGSQADVVGTVVDEAGRAVAGATVTVEGSRKNSRSTTSDRDGGFRLAVEPLSGGRIYVRLVARGEDGRLGFLLVAQRTPEPVRVVLKPARALDVVVVGRDGGPVADAEVEFLGDMIRLAGGRTDAEGHWAGRVPADVKAWAVTARRPGAGFEYATAERARGSLEGPRPLPERLTLTLAGARTLRVKVVDRAGKPIAGAKVGPWYIQTPGHEAHVNLSGTTAAWPETGDDGVAVLDWLPERFEQALPILVNSEGYYAADHATSIQAGDPAGELTLTLLPVERLSGRVTHADGRPAAGLLVSAQGQGSGHHIFRGGARTDADGRYSLRVYSEQAYVVAVTDATWAAPYRAGVVVRAGKPVDGVDFTLARATRLHGRVTLGTDGPPVAGAYLNAAVDAGQIPQELRREGDRTYWSVRMDFGTQTDADGRYEFRLGPGEYKVRGPARTEPATVTIPAGDPPAEVVRDFAMPRPETGPLAGRVVDARGNPVAGAVVVGRYASGQARRWFHDQTTDAGGQFRVERSLDPLVLHARTADGALAGVARSDAETAEAQVVVGPLATASGRLTDLAGRPIGLRELRYGIRIYDGEPGNSPFSDNFGGKATTDAQGRFALAGLVPGEPYQVSLQLDEHSSRSATEVTAKGPGPVDLGDVLVDPDPPKPYVPPTPAKRTAEAFAARRSEPPRERLANVLAEARREYTRPLLLLGRPADPACIELYRLFHEEPARAGAEGDQAGVARRPKSAAELRWEFELAALDVDRPEVRRFADELGVAAGEGAAPVLVVLDADGSVAATRALRPDAAGTLDGRSLGAFLAEHKRPTRDAERMLAEALTEAKAADKRVFFILSASWCGPCRLLSRFLAEHKDELARHYVFVKLDISRDDHADTVGGRFPASSGGGVPWYAILDADGRVLATSDAAALKPRYGNANIGFPSDPAAIEHLLKMLERTAPRLSGEALKELRKALSKQR